MTRIYLASPYTDPDEAVMENRYYQTLEATAFFLGQKMQVFSPIVYCHPMAVRHGLPRDAGFWIEFNHSWMDWATEFWILQLPGWRESTGVAKELRYARNSFKKIIYYDPETGTGLDTCIRKGDRT